ncbi:MAG: Nif3-like dinuclear metal center hexameric protein [Clostridia bacterium]|nr:Nif3-like dinuclear metal center hexameric protein [Clostridia bacterium]
MKLNNIIDELEKLAPLSLSREYCEKFGLYDNSGVILNCGKEINKILFSLDFSVDAVNKAISGGYNLIITHHPAIFGGIKSINVDVNPLSKKLALCLQNGISVVSAHLNLDAAEEGIDYFLMKGMGGTSSEIMDKLSCGGYGRAYAISQTNFKDLVERTRTQFNTNKLRAYGNENSVIKKVASFCGSGTDDKALAFAVANGVDLVVSADMKHHHVAELIERGICVIELTHYASENFGFTKIAEKLSNRFEIPCYIHTDKILL